MIEEVILDAKGRVHGKAADAVILATDDGVKVPYIPDPKAEVDENRNIYTL